MGRNVFFKDGLQIHQYCGPASEEPRRRYLLRISGEQIDGWTIDQLNDLKCVIETEIKLAQEASKK